jgi:hypothetical protein
VCTEEDEQRNKEEETNEQRKAMLWLRDLVPLPITEDSLQLQAAFHVAFVTVKVIMGQVFLREFAFSL